MNIFTNLDTFSFESANNYRKDEQFFRNWWIFLKFTNSFCLDEHFIEINDIFCLTNIFLKCMNSFLIVELFFVIDNHLFHFLEHLKKHGHFLNSQIQIHKYFFNMRTFFQNHDLVLIRKYFRLSGGKSDFFLNGTFLNQELF